VNRLSPDVHGGGTTLAVDPLAPLMGRRLFSFDDSANSANTRQQSQ